MKVNLAVFMEAVPPTLAQNIFGRFQTASHGQHPAGEKSRRRRDC